MGQEGHSMAEPRKGLVKRRLAAIIAAGILALGHGFLSLAAYAQQTDKLPRVGVLSVAPLTSAHYEAFRHGLRDLGYVEGRNIAFVAKSAEGDPDRFSELAAKRLQLLTELLSPLTRVAILYNPEDRNKEWEYKQSQEAADKLKLTLRAYEARSSIEIDEAFARMVDDHAQALIIFADLLTFVHQKKLADLALTHRLPAMFGFREFTELGGLISYGASVSEMWRRAAPYVDKILRGADPGELPIDQPTRFELIVNVKTAKTLGIQVPASLLVRADKVIE